MTSHKNPRTQSTGDYESANELALFIENDRDLHRQRVEPIAKNLAIKINNGTYDATKAMILWNRLADDGAKLYKKEFGDSFDLATRKLAAMELAERYEELIQPHNWVGQRGLKKVTISGLKNPRLTGSLTTASKRGDKTIILKIVAPNTAVGNPRHAFLFFNFNGSVTHFVNIAYKSGEQVLDEHFNNKKEYIYIGTIGVTIPTFNKAAKIK